eukprot:scaffold17244_cov55-Attheya_sp.AAC.4
MFCSILEAADARCFDRNLNCAMMTRTETSMMTSIVSLMTSYWVQLGGRPGSDRNKIGNGGVGVPFAKNLAVTY